MDFDQAIAAHSIWKRKLTQYLGHQDGSLKASEVGMDNKCALGQWIHGEGSKFSTLPEFSTLKGEHARFHKAVAEVLKKVESGQPVTEAVELGPKSAFAVASSAVVLAITTIKKRGIE